MDKREFKSAIESILFVWSEPLHINELGKILEIEISTLKALISELSDEIEHYRRGIIINNFDGYLQMSSRPGHESYISKLLKVKKKNISNSAMETLSIIAYKQPITRVEIDNIRGVKSYSSIESLTNLGLIEEVGRLDKIGRPILYGTTMDFLKAFDISSLKDLPKIEKINDLGGGLQDDENQ